MAEKKKYYPKEIVILPQHEDTEMLIDGIRYKLKKEKMDKDFFHILKKTFVKINEDDYNTRLENIVKEIEKRSKVSLGMILIDALRCLDLSKIEQIEKKLKNKKIKPKVEEGCLGIRIGDVLVDIV
jgi:hypothetical protein